MADPTSITAAFSSVKTALDIAKLIREGSASLERAELSLKLADLMSSLADAKIELAQVQDLVAAKDRRISELETAFERREEVIKVNDAIYAKGSTGGAIGDPYCLRCWEADHQLRPLATSAKDHRIKECHFCKAAYNNMRASRFAEETHPR